MRGKAACKRSKTETLSTVKWKCSPCRLILYSKINLNPEFCSEFFTFRGILKASDIYTYNSNKHFSVVVNSIVGQMLHIASLVQLVKKKKETRKSM